MRLAAPDRRARILEAALPVLARRGVSGAGTRDLARAAGVSEPILYRHFAGKDGLLSAVLREVVEARVLASIEEAAGRRGPPRRRIEALAEALPGLLEARRDELRVLAGAALAHERPEVLEAAAAVTRRIGRALATLAGGRGRTAAGFLLLQVGLGASLLHRLPVPEVESPKARRAIRDAVTRAILR